MGKTRDAWMREYGVEPNRQSIQQQISDQQRLMLQRYFEDAAILRKVVKS